MYGDELSVDIGTKQYMFAMTVEDAPLQSVVSSVNVTPSDYLIRTLYFSIGDPLVVGAVQAISTLVDDTEVVTAAIYPGTDDGMTVKTVEYGPLP